MYNANIIHILRYLLSLIMHTLITRIGLIKFACGIVKIQCGLQIANKEKSRYSEHDICRIKNLNIIYT